MIHILRSARDYRNWSALCDEAHQVKEVAAFLHKSSTGVGIKTIPIVNFFEKWITMFPNCNHSDCTNCPLFNLLQHSRRRCHVPIFESDPNNLLFKPFASLQRYQFLTIGHSRAQWFFYQQMLSRPKNF